MNPQAKSGIIKAAEAASGTKELGTKGLRERGMPFPFDYTCDRVTPSLNALIPQCLLRFQRVNRLPERHEPRFIFRHDIVFRLVFVQIQRNVRQLKPAARKRAQRRFKQNAVVGLLANFAARHEYFFIDMQKAVVRQTALGLPLFFLTKSHIGSSAAAILMVIIYQWITKLYGC